MFDNLHYWTQNGFLIKAAVCHMISESSNWLLSLHPKLTNTMCNCAGKFVTPFLIILLCARMSPLTCYRCLHPPYRRIHLFHCKYFVRSTYICSTFSVLNQWTSIFFGQWTEHRPYWIYLELWIFSIRIILLPRKINYPFCVFLKQ